MRQRGQPVLMVVCRLLGVALTAGMGWIHLELWVADFREVPVVGPLFLINVIGSGVLAAALLVAPARLLSAVAGTAAAFTAGTLAALVVSLTVGLFEVHETLQAPLVASTLIVESLGVLVLGFTVALGARSRRPRGE